MPAAESASAGGTRVGLVLIALLACCGDPEHKAPSVGTNSNWLTACTLVTECEARVSCHCGACTNACASDSACGDLGAAHCALPGDPALASLCGGAGEPGPGLCLPDCSPGSCPEDQACVGDACVLALPTGVAFCDAVRRPELRDRTREDELLELVQALRTNGGARCGGAAPASPAPALRLDRSLLCAARVLAADLEQTHRQSLVDSAGRTSQDRFDAVGYLQRMWGESFALDARSAQDALDFMLRDLDTCRRLVDPRFTDLGVGSAGRTMVLSIANQ